MRRLAFLLAALWALPVFGQIPGGAEIQIGRTPITQGTNGLCLYQSNGKVAEQVCGAGTAANIQVGTTTVGGGTTTRILYDNAGVLGEYTLTGSGTVVAMQSSPTFTAALDSASLTVGTTGSTSIGYYTAPAGPLTILTFKGSYAAGDIISAWNTDSTGYSTFVPRDETGRYHGGFGYGNSGSSSSFANSFFWETWNGRSFNAVADAGFVPPDHRLIATGWNPFLAGATCTACTTTGSSTTLTVAGALTGIWRPTQTVTISAVTFTIISQLTGTSGGAGTYLLSGTPAVLSGSLTALGTDTQEVMMQFTYTSGNLTIGCWGVHSTTCLTLGPTGNLTTRGSGTFAGVISSGLVITGASSISGVGDFSQTGNMNWGASTIPNWSSSTALRNTSNGIMKITTSNQAGGANLDFTTADTLKIKNLANNAVGTLDALFSSGGTVGIASCTAVTLGATVTIKGGIITAFTGC